MNRSVRGFTLAELMIVIAIIGVLLSVALPVLTEWRCAASMRKHVETDYRVSVKETWCQRYLVNQETVYQCSALFEDAEGVWQTVEAQCEPGGECVTIPPRK